jgi:hypothetical protein
MKFKCPHWAMYMLMFTACAAAPWLRSMATSWSFAYELGRMDLSAAELERIARRPEEPIPSRFELANGGNGSTRDLAKFSTRQLADYEARTAAELREISAAEQPGLYALISSQREQIRSEIKRRETAMGPCHSPSRQPDTPASCERAPRSA